MNEMDDMYLQQVATTMLKQIVNLIGISAFWSWGVSKKSFGIHNDMPTLYLKVNGFQHKGWVLVSLNEGEDLYEIELQNNRGKVLFTRKGVYFDELGVILDKLIETGEQTAEEYKQQVNHLYGW